MAVGLSCTVGAVSRISNTRCTPPIAALSCPYNPPSPARLPAMEIPYIRKPVIIARVSRPAMTSRPPYHMIAAIELNPRNIMIEMNRELKAAIRSDGWRVLLIAPL